MKKSIITAGFALGAIVFGTNNVNAQNHTAITTANIKLAHVISIESVGGDVNFNYETAAHYNTDQTVKLDNNLKVTSTQPFGISVKAGGANFVDGGKEIPVTVLRIKALDGTTNTMGGSRGEFQLSNTPNNTFVTAAPLGAEKNLSVEYTIVKEQAQNVLLGKADGNYTQTVKYTATAE